MGLLNIMKPFFNKFFSDFFLGTFIYHTKSKKNEVSINEILEPYITKVCLNVRLPKLLGIYPGVYLLDNVAHF